MVRVPGASPGTSVASPGAGTRAARFAAAPHPAAHQRSGQGGERDRHERDPGLPVPRQPGVEPVGQVEAGQHAGRGVAHPALDRVGARGHHRQRPRAQGVGHGPGARHARGHVSAQGERPRLDQQHPEARPEPVLHPGIAARDADAQAEVHLGGAQASGGQHGRAPRREPARDRGEERAAGHPHQLPRRSRLTRHRLRRLGRPGGHGGGGSALHGSSLPPPRRSRTPGPALTAERAARREISCRSTSLRSRRWPSSSARPRSSPTGWRWWTATERMTYRDLAARVTRTAHALRASGIGPGERVAYLCPNTPELLVGPLRGAARRRGAGRAQHPPGPRGGAFDLHALRRAPAGGRRRAARDRRTRARTVSATFGRSSGPATPARRTACPGSPTPSCWSAAPTPRCRGRSTTRTRRSRSTTPRAPRASPRG